MNDLEAAAKLGLALAIGLLIGTERGWHERGLKEGARVAGIRTFGLISLVGALCAMSAKPWGGVIIAAGLLGICALVTVSYSAASRLETDLGITTEVAVIATFLLGATAVLFPPFVAASTSVVAVIVLEAKPAMHKWVKGLEEDELAAGIKLLLISVVLLPVLPDKGYGPWQSLNPHVIWWMVVLVAAISFGGYLGVKTIGPRWGILVTSVLGGLVSSTALTMTFSRQAGKDKEMAPLLAAGILAASGTMFPRIGMELTAVNPDLLPRALPALAAMGVVSYALAAAVWLLAKGPQGQHGYRAENPLELGTALRFGAFLALIMLLAKAMKTWMGAKGVYWLSAISGLTDVDAITLSLAQMAKADLAQVTAVTGILTAAMVNTGVKGVMASIIGGKKMVLYVGLASLAVIFAGLISIFLTGLR